MNNAITAYLLIDRLVRQKGIVPIEEGIGACWKTSLQDREIENPPGWEIYANAFEYRDAGLTFVWSLGLVEASEDKPDAIASLEYGVTVSPPDCDYEYHPKLMVEFRHSTGVWKLIFKNNDLSWDYPGNEPAKLAREFGLSNGDPDSGAGHLAERTLTEIEVRAIITYLAQHAKERQLV